jgi:hypothetical protein
MAYIINERGEVCEMPDSVTLEARCASTLDPVRFAEPHEIETFLAERANARPW